MPPPAFSPAPLLVVYGATGGTGKALVAQALAAGLRVRVFVRKASKLPADAASHANLEVFQGDLTDLDSVTAALQGATYAICVAGSRQLSANGGMRKAVRGIVDAMPRHDVTRFLYQAGAFSPFPGRPLTPMRGFLRFVLGGFLGFQGVLADNDAVIDLLSETRDVQWVVTLPGGIQHGPSRGELRSSDIVGSTVRYVDVATFNLDVVQSGRYNGKGLYPAYN